MNMLPIELRIDRALRLLRMIEEDRPLLELRVAPLSREHQELAKSHAQLLAELTRAEIQKLHREKALAESADATACPSLRTAEPPAFPAGQKLRNPLR